jgi:cysteinyl-tRNA synthetase
MKIRLYNTLSKKKEVFLPTVGGFNPLKEKKVLLYGCGVTPYDFSHIGHGRSYVFVDLLVRFLRFSGYSVKYVRNVTDIDDKLLRKAKEAGDMMGYTSLAQKFTDQYRKEMGLLNNFVPDAEPKVTENIPQIIDFIKKLVEKDIAYVINHDVYFDVTKYESYGELSGKNLEDLQAGARVAVDERKKNPADFVLWKGNEDELFWKSPWGYGRPGWHIECSALAKEYLGESIDIHCGGSDLIFPHHENERAQSESLFKKQFVRYWVHNALLNIDKEKMSKSLGNILSLQEIFAKYDPMILRYYFLQHHYRTPIDFTFDRLASAQVAYKKLVKVFEGVKNLSKISQDNEIVQSMIDALADDLNSPKVLGILFENLSIIRDDENLAQSVKFFLQNVFGLTFHPIAEEKLEITPEIEELVRKREEARSEKNWAVADQIRDQLRDLGVDVQDKPS